MQISTAIHLMRQACVLRHFSFKTDKTYVYWLGRYGAFLQDQRIKTWTTEQKIERFLTVLATAGSSASTQNQAFNALRFFYRDPWQPVKVCESALKGGKPLKGLKVRKSGYTPVETGC